MNRHGVEELIYMDEVGTPDSSRIWDAAEYLRGNIVENSKEGFRQALLGFVPDADLLVNKNRMQERYQFASDNLLPAEMMLDVAHTYSTIAEKITGGKLRVSDRPRDDIIDILNNTLGLIT